MAIRSYPALAARPKRLTRLARFQIASAAVSSPGGSIAERWESVTPA
jgi:hypothetical protein